MDDDKAGLKIKKPDKLPGFFLQRRRDSNSRNLSVQRFSRPPQSTTLPLLCLMKVCRICPSPKTAPGQNLSDGKCTAKFCIYKKGKGKKLRVNAGFVALVRSHALSEKARVTAFLSAALSMLTLISKQIRIIYEVISSQNISAIMVPMDP